MLNIPDEHRPITIFYHALTVVTQDTWPAVYVVNSANSLQIRFPVTNHQAFGGKVYRASMAVNR